MDAESACEYNSVFMCDVICVCVVYLCVGVRLRGRGPMAKEHPTPEPRIFFFLRGFVTVGRISPSHHY